MKYLNITPNSPLGTFRYGDEMTWEEKVELAAEINRVHASCYPAEWVSFFGIGDYQEPEEFDDLEEFEYDYVVARSPFSGAVGYFFVQVGDSSLLYELDFDGHGVPREMSNRVQSAMGRNPTAKLFRIMDICKPATGDRRLDRVAGLHLKAAASDFVDRIPKNSFIAFESLYFDNNPRSAKGLHFARRFMKTHSPDFSMDLMVEHNASDYYGHGDGSGAILLLAQKK